MAAIDYLASMILTRLVWTSLQTAALVGIVALLVRLRPRLPAAACCALWWLVGMQAVLGLCWHTPIEIPILPPLTGAITIDRIVMPPQAEKSIDAWQAMPPSSYGLAGATTVQGLPQTISSTTSLKETTTWRSIHWRALLVELWLCVLLLRIFSILRQHRRTHNLRRAAQPMEDAVLLSQCAQQALALGLRRTPLLLASVDICSPLVCGFWRSVVIWPAGDVLTKDEGSLALAHELAHLKRGDLLLGWIPTLAQSLLFFHPLLRWAMREYSLQREIACDAQVLQQQSAMPQIYGRLLLRLGIARYPHAGLASASPTFHNLKRRLTMLRQSTSLMPLTRSWLVVGLIAFAGVLPYRVVAAGHTTQDTDKTYYDNAMVPPAPPVPLPPPLSPSSPPPPQPPPSPSSESSMDFDIGATANNYYAYALFDGAEGHNMVVEQGNSADKTSVDRLHSDHQPMFWFRLGDKSYLIHDRNYIARARVIYAPVSDYWRDAGKLEGVLWDVKGPLEGLASELRSVESQRRELLDDNQTPAVKEQLEDIDSHQREINERMGGLEKQLISLQPQMEAMKQRQLQVVAHADGEALKLVEEALTRGMAQDVSRG